MRKAAILTVGRQLNDGETYIFSMYDLEPAGLLVRRAQRPNRTTNNNNNNNNKDGPQAASGRDTKEARRREERRRESERE
jgi:hypothetical protein